MANDAVASEMNEQAVLQDEPQPQAALGLDDATESNDEHDAERDAPLTPTAAPGRPTGRRRSERLGWVKSPITAGVVAVIAISVLTGWLAVGAHHAQQDNDRRALLLEVGRQGALNLTTIDYEHVDADIQRILDSATGTFYDDFVNRSKPFTDVVVEAKSKSQGTITEAGIETADDDHAQVLAAVSVTTSTAGNSDQQPRAWRMRLSVQMVDDQAKVDNVEFVP